MIKRPLSYNARERIIVDADFRTVLTVFNRMGVPYQEVDKDAEQLIKDLNEVDKLREMIVELKDKKQK
jgi:hypothetical protein